MHYLLIITIIAVIVIIQLRFFSNTKRKISDFLRIFPEKADEYKLQKEALIDTINSAKDDDLNKMLETCGLNPDEYHSVRQNADGEDIPVFQRKKARKDLIDKLANDTVGITVSLWHNNETLKTIVNSINDYLKNNKTVSDFHLMKDIVDRNCDAKEEEISTQIPVPLYMGLVGTMAGILIGILYLWLSGGIGDLLSTGGGSGADGVEALLGGVALAMISSILGIILTTWGSNKFKTAKSIVEKNKHGFLSWIQAKLLPTLSDNVVGAIRAMTANLNNFNDKFAQNTGNLGSALVKVNESYKMQVQLLNVVKKISEKDLTRQNLQLYHALQNSTAEIGTLAEYLKNCNDYLANVRALNDKLDVSEQRTKAIEGMAAFFKDEIEQIEQRKEAINKAIGKIDSIIEERLRKLGENAADNVENFYKALGKQQDALQRKLDETEVIVSELKNLSAIKDSIAKFEKATSEQNQKIDKLSETIKELAQVKAVGGKIKITLPKWLKIGSVVIGIIIIITCLFLIFEKIWHYIS